jgi:hypothetical protein
MGKKANNKNKNKNNNQNKKSSIDYPFVSVCTPTFNRRPFIETMFQCFRNQDYPKSRIEWIIVDDGTDKIEDLIQGSNIPQIRYFKVDKKMFLGAKRNYMHSFAKGSIIVYMDDDDYYPPERISHSVEKLQSDPFALCAGSSEIYVYFKTLTKMIQCGPYHDTHATAGTFAFKRELLEQTKYEEGAAIAEERAFLKGYTIPFVQLDPLKTILVFSHDHNTFDKKKMFDQQQDEKYFKESNKNVNDFIRLPKEEDIKQFFLKDIDGLLEKYKPGLPDMKPDVLKQIKEIEKEREEMKKEALRQMQQTNIHIEEPGKGRRNLTTDEVVELLRKQQEDIKELNNELNKTRIMMKDNNGNIQQVQSSEVVNRILFFQNKSDLLESELKQVKSTLNDKINELIQANKIIEHFKSNNNGYTKIPIEE